MKSYLYPCSEHLRDQASTLGISALGIAQIKTVSSDTINCYRNWIKANLHGTMSYMERYDSIRYNPDLLLPNAKSIIVAAFNYYHPLTTRANQPQFASYSLGTDYHEIVRNKLNTLASYITNNWGGETRVCVDTAPIFERYWAQQAGIGFIGRNSMLIVPNIGSYVFLGIILSTTEFIPNEPSTQSCIGCNACIRKCPGKALSINNLFDARKCNSYLTIEYRDELPSNTLLENRIYGCDVCQQVCPHNINAPTTTIPEFLPRKEILALSYSDIEEMTQEQFSRIFTHSAIKRTKLSGLQRNCRHCTPKQE